MSGGVGVSDGTTLLELAALSVHYGSVSALERVSLGVRPGEKIAIMGPNGAGKSTVLKAIMGLAPVTAGDVLWHGAPLVRATHEVVREGIAFVPQGRRLFSHLTIEENLEIGCLYAVDRPERQRRMDAVMELFPVLHGKRRDLASQMSGGQQQMLALGRGLMADPQLLLLDEPTLGLSPVIVKEVFGMISVISERLGTTIILVEHNVKGALELVDRAYVLVQGRVAFTGSASAVRDGTVLADAFLGKIDLPDGS